MIIDDEVELTYLLKRYLERKDCSVEVAHNLEEGIKKLDSIDPYYILLDNNLPDGLGWEKANYIRENHPESRLVLMSGADARQIPGENFKILEKPFSLEQLEQLMFCRRPSKHLLSQ